MKPLTLTRAVACLFFLFLTNRSFSQVKIGGNPKEDPHPSAVLELQGTDKGLLLPRLSQQQMLSVKQPANALVVYNTDAKNVFIYSEDRKEWMPLMQEAQRLGEDSCEWVFDTSALRVFLVRGYPLGDSVYYNTARRKFIFTDKVNVEGSNTPADVFYPGKYIFKGNASGVYHDSASLNFPSITLSNFLFAIDNDSFAVANPNLAFYNGMRISTQMLPTASQKASTVRSLLLQVNHTGPDSINAVTALASNAFVDGQGYTATFNGIQNNMSISSSATNNIGTITGYRSLISMAPDAGGRVNGSVFGYVGSISGFRDTLNNSLINGNAYGIFLNNITAAQPKRNFAFYSGKGHNRFGDSTLVTDNFALNPRAVFDVNSTSAMITPAGTTAQRPVSAVIAMLRHNNDNATMEYFNGTTWKALSSDSAEWKFDAGTNRVNLVRGLPSADTVFYNPVSRKFVFSDRFTNTNSLGNDFPVDAFNGKYTFKSTASQRTDPALQDGAVANIVYEVDNAAAGTVYTATSSSAVMNPKAFQKADQLAGFSNTTIHAGNDSVQLVIGMVNTARNSGNGRSGSITGIQNIARIQNGTNNNTGELVGFRNIVGRTGSTAGRVTGNVYGWFGSFTGLANNVDGNIYGVFLSNVTGATGSKNFAFYSNRGVNRFGDSVVITTGAAAVPRAVLDVNSTSAMIVPTGNTAQRPSAAVAGMVRYNTDNGGRLETYNGSAWGGILSGGIGIDPPNIPTNSGITTSFAFTGATVGSVVAISPSSALPNGIVIAWARVSAANVIEMRFENNSTAPVNPPSIGYNIRVIQ
jgi:hypothetical protein